jgi:choline dehydrogenase-like flavoprotein
MFVDARSIANESLLEADLCIIGAGAAGITLAREFVDSGLTVCLLESGAFAPDWATQALGQGETSGLRYSDLDTCQIRYFGGNSNAWGGWLRPLDELDFQERPWVENSGWPFPLSELQPYYDRAHRLCEAASSDYDVQEAVQHLADVNARVIPFDPGKLETILYRFSPPTRFGQSFHETFRKADNLKCLVNATACAVETTQDGRTATKVRVGCLSGTRFAITARKFVLAAGAIENARLLLVSNEIVANGLGNQHNLVGRFFMDHPHTTRAFIPSRRAPPLGLYGLSFRGRGVSAGISLPSVVQEQEKLLNYKASIYPIYYCHTSRGWLSFRDLVLSLDPQWRTDPYDRLSLPFKRKRVSFRQLWDILRECDKVAMAGALQVLKPNRFLSRFILESKPEQAPNPNSRITLTTDRDALGVNRVRLDWRLLPCDTETVRRAEDMIDSELQRLGIGRLAPLTAPERDGWAETVVGGWHQIGTTRMHHDPRHGVADADGRVHGTSNLFIAGASLFPTGGAVSPTPTILALALRLADCLRRLEAGAGRAAAAVEPRLVADLSLVGVEAVGDDCDGNKAEKQQGPGRQNDDKAQKESRARRDGNLDVNPGTSDS